MAHSPFVSVIGKAFNFIIAAMVTMQLLPWVIPATRDLVPHLRCVMLAAQTHFDVDPSTLRWKIRLNDVSGFF